MRSVWRSEAKEQSENGKWFCWVDQGHEILKPIQKTGRRGHLASFTSDDFDLQRIGDKLKLPVPWIADASFTL